MMQEYASLLGLLMSWIDIRIDNAFLVMFEEAVLCLRANGFGDGVKSTEVRTEEG